MKHSAILIFCVATVLGLGLLSATADEKKPKRVPKRGFVDLDFLLEKYERRDALLASIASVGTRQDLAAREHRKKVRQIFLDDVAAALSWYGRRYVYESIVVTRRRWDRTSASPLLGEELPPEGFYYYDAKLEISSLLLRGLNDEQFLESGRRQRPIPAPPPAPR